LFCRDSAEDEKIFAFNTDHSKQPPRQYKNQ